MAKITGFGDAFRTLAAESGTMRGHPMMNTSVHYACESDEQAAVLQADAAQDAADMVADIFTKPLDDKKFIKHTVALVGPNGVKR